MRTEIFGPEGHLSVLSKFQTHWTIRNEMQQSLAAAFEHRAPDTVVCQFDFQEPFKTMFRHAQQVSGDRGPEVPLCRPFAVWVSQHSSLKDQVGWFPKGSGDRGPVGRSGRSPDPFLFSPRSCRACLRGPRSQAPCSMPMRGKATAPSRCSWQALEVLPEVAGVWCFLAVSRGQRWLAPRPASTASGTTSTGQRASRWRPSRTQATTFVP